MNRIFRTLWSVATQSWQAVPETAKTAGKKSASSASGVVASVALSFALTGGAGAQSPPAVNQLPTGGTVVRGTATISQTATSQAAAMTVNQTSQRAVVNWNTFNLGSAASVNFVQPNAQAVILNRVTDSNPSQIFGRITSNGQVFITNANGVYFSPTSSVDVGAITATTHSISNDNFMSGNYVFDRNGATGKVVNEGRINAALGGYVALLAPEVQNAGVVVARAGTVAMAAGETITLNINGAGSLAGITTTPSTIATLIENKQAVQAPDGLIILSAMALNKLQAGVIKNSGSLEANSLVSKGGKIYLEGDDITLTSTSKIEAKGATSGGTVLVGGDWQGSGDMRQAIKVTMEAGATIDASATDKGDGGKVVLWSDIHNAESQTRGHGSIKAEAGLNGGNGGQIETSGYYLNTDNLQVSTQSSLGEPGEWLLDPYNINITSSSSGTAFIASTSDYIYNPSLTSNISASTLNAALVNGNVTISTAGTGGNLGDISVNDAIYKTSGSTTTLKLNANRNISIAAAISGSTNAPLNVVIAARATGESFGKVTISAPIKSFGGNISIGGGDPNASGYAIANGTDTYAGVDISNVIDASSNGSGTSDAVLPTGSTGGNIAIRGKGNDTSNYFSWGIHAQGKTVNQNIVPASIITAGSGSIYLDGMGGKPTNVPAGWAPVGAPTYGYWAVASVGVVLEKDVYIKSNTGKVTINGRAGTGDDRYGIASTESSKLIGTNGIVLIDGDSLLIRDGELTINAGSPSDIKAPILNCNAPIYCGSSTLTQIGSGVLNLWGNAQAWNQLTIQRALTDPDTAPISTNNSFTFNTASNAVNLVNLTRAQALASFSAVPTSINTVTESSAFGIYIKETVSTGIYGNLTFAYQVVDALGNPLVLNAGSYKDIDISGDNPVYNLASNASVGSYTVSYQSGLGLTGAAAATYHLRPYSTATPYTITARPVTITNNTVAATYDGVTTYTTAVENAGYIHTAMVGTDSIGSVTQTITDSSGTALTGAAQAGLFNSLPSNAVLSSGQASNYLFTYIGSNINNISKANINVVNPIVENKIYDGTTTASLTGTLNGVAAVDANRISLISAGNFTVKDAGNGIAVIPSYRLNGFAANNYNLVQPSGLYGNINKASLTVTAADAVKNFGDPNPIFSINLSGFVGGETLTTSGVTGSGLGTTTATNTTDAGAIAIKASLGTLAANNYSFTNLVDGNLTIKPIPTLTNTQVSKLIGTQLANLTAVQISSFNNSQLQVFSGQQIASLSESQISGLTATQLSTLSASQLQSITSEQIKLLNVTQLNGFTPSQFSAFTNSQLRAISIEKITDVSPTQLSLLSPEQIELITENSLLQLNYQQIFSLAPNQMSALNPVQIARLNAAEIGSFNDLQIQSLNIFQLKAIAPRNFSALSVEQIMAMSASQLASLTPEQLAGLTPIQVASLNQFQIQGFSDLQLAAIGIYTKQEMEKTFEISMALLPEISNMSGIQIRSLSPDQLNALSKYQLANLSPAQLQALTTSQLSQLTPEQAGNLTRSQLSVMNHRQLQALPVRKILENRTQTGILSITFLQPAEAKPLVKGVIYQQSSESITLTMSALPVVPIAVNEAIFSEIMTAFTASSGSGEKIKFHGSFNNNHIIIVAPSKAAKDLVQKETNLVLTAALTMLIKFNQILLPQLNGIIIDIR